MTSRILVVDDEQIIRESIGFILTREGYTVREAVNGRDALDKIREEPFDLVITDLEMPEMKGIELIDAAGRKNPETIFVVITAYGSLETAIAALRGGASDYILKPVEFDELLVKVKRLLDYRRLAVENQLLRREVAHEYEFENIIGKSEPILKVFDAIQRVAPTESTVLITGRSGTGKELVARAIHFRGNRQAKPFITVNCGALTETIIESELFGHRKGAFTGAVADKPGYFKAAEGGTLFLDEISEMPIHLQVRLLRAIESKEITPVGMSTSTPIDVRFIAATNRNLAEEIAVGRFRADLYYRLNVVEIHLPSLTERPDDIPLLVEYFLDKYRRAMSKNIRGVSTDAMRALVGHDWRGEIRELENAIERAVIFCTGDMLTPAEFPAIAQNVSGLPVAGDDISLHDAIAKFESQFIIALLKKFGNDKEATARSLKVSLATLYRRLKDLSIPI